MFCNSILLVTRHAFGSSLVRSDALDPSKLATFQIQRKYTLTKPSYSKLFKISSALQHIWPCSVPISSTFSFNFAF